MYTQHFEKKFFKLKFLKQRKYKTVKITIRRKTARVIRKIVTRNPKKSRFLVPKNKRNRVGVFGPARPSSRPDLIFQTGPDRAPNTKEKPINSKETRHNSTNLFNFK